MRLIAPLMPTTIPIWTMNNRKKLPSAKFNRASLDRTTAATPAVRSSPANIHAKAWVRNAWASRASGTTPSVAGEAPVIGPADPVTFGVVPGAVGLLEYWLGIWFCVIVVPRPPRSRGSPHQAGVARVPALGQQGHFHVVIDDGLGLFLDLRDHGARVRAEGGCQDHLDLGRIGAEQDLFDERELDDIHPDLGVDDSAQRIEDRELRRPAGGIEGGVGGGRGGSRRGRLRKVCGGLGRAVGHGCSPVCPLSVPSSRFKALRGRGEPDQAAGFAAFTTMPGTRYWAGSLAASSAL